VAAASAEQPASEPVTRPVGPTFTPKRRGQDLVGGQPPVPLYRPLQHGRARTIRLASTTATTRRVTATGDPSG
jgi:hypothetical protein